MIEATNPHARNLKVISIAYILHWWLELAPSQSGELNLAFISYTINNTAPLPFISLIFLIYFFWRFELSENRNILKELAALQKIDLGKSDSLMQEVQIEVDQLMNSSRKISLSTDHRLEKAVYERTDKSRIILVCQYSLKDIAYPANKPRLINADLLSLFKDKRHRILKAVLKLKIVEPLKYLASHEETPEIIIPRGLALIAFFLAIGSIIESYIAIPFIGSLILTIENLLIPLLP